MTTFARRFRSLPRRGDAPRDPVVRDRHRRPPPRRPLAGRRPDGRRGRGWPSSTHWTAAFEALDPATLDRDDAIDRDLILGELDAPSGSATRSSRRSAGTRSTGSTCWATACSCCSSREFAPLADRLASVAGRLEGMPAAARRRPGRARRARPTADRSAGSRPRPRSTSCRRSASSSTRRWPRRDEAAGRPGRRRRPTAARCRRGDGPGRARRRSRRTCARSSCRRATATAAWARTCSPARCATRCARTTLTPDRILAAAEREFVAVRAEMVRLAGDLWPTWCPDEPAAGRRGRARPRRPRCDRRRAPGGGRPARLLPRRERPDRGVLPRARPHRPGRRADGHPLDAGLPARLRRRDAHLARPARQGPDDVLRHHPDARRLDRRSSASRTCARTTTGCSGC